MTVTARIVPQDTDEREIRQELAACYRLLHRYGMTDLIFTHVSARLPGTDGHFLINPYGLLFDEITASNLIEVDAHGNVVGDSPWDVNWAGHIIHGAVLAARPDVNCVIHCHTRAGVAISMLACGLKTVSQHAMEFHNRIAYHDYEGFAEGRDECPRLAANLGAHNAMIMRNHGLLTAGATIGQAFLAMYNLDIACKTQLDAMATGTPLIEPSEEIREFVGALNWDPDGDEAPGKRLAWQALIRRLDREDPSYRD